MSATTVAAAKAAAALLTDPKTRKAIGWILVAILSPLILLIAFLCSLGSGSAESNNVAVKACFYPTALSESIPAEYRTHVEDMRTAFSLLDSAVAGVNSQMESGNSLDPIRVKAVFTPFALARMCRPPGQRVTLSAASIRQRQEPKQ